MVGLCPVAGQASDTLQWMETTPEASQPARAGWVGVLPCCYFTDSLMVFMVLWLKDAPKISLCEGLGISCTMGAEASDSSVCINSNIGKDVAVKDSQRKPT